MRHLVLAVAVAFVLAAASPASLAAQGAPESAAFVVRLGVDTVAVERFSRSATRLEGTLVTRSPRTVLRRYAADLGPDGVVTRFEVSTHSPAAPADATPLQRLTITGGLAACDYLCEVLAEVTQMTVERPTLLEATARGIAYLAAGQPPDWQPVPIEKSFAPTGKHPVRDRFDGWRAAMAVRTGAA